ncbi:hypothetical protein ACFCYF_24990 [Streptomyces chartreusis]|nr:hypothetical protein [Streptomyces chartreusis]WUB16939.1 hypothetical protein OG997_09575 [Streptomyces chartreusis]
MRRATVQKPLKRQSSTRRRVQEEAEESPSGRPEVRKDIAQTWWPDS